MDRRAANIEAQVMALWDSGCSKRRIESVLNVDRKRILNIVQRLAGGGNDDRRREAAIRDGCRRYGVALARTGKVYA